MSKNIDSIEHLVIWRLIKGSELRNITIYLLIFALVLTLPVLAAFVFALFGYRVSNIGTSLLTSNYIVGQILALGIFSLLVGGIVFHVFFHRFFLKTTFDDRLEFIKYRLDILFVGSLLVLSYIGLLNSFPGTFLTVEYRGATSAWLGVGAWGVLFLFCFEFILATFLDMRRHPYIRLLAVFFVFLPILLYGSRIDFLSCLIAELVAYMLFSAGGIRKKATFFVVIVLIIFVISSVVGGIRYSYGKDGYKISDTFSQQQEYMVKSRQSGVIYLSTIGDIGTSVYQAVDARNNIQSVANFDLLDMAVNYSQRILPGFLSPNRPADVYAGMGLNFGGGALHALGEGYFFAGLFGVIIIGLVFGLFVSISYSFRARFIKAGEPLYWIIFIAPWALIIRGGWYQFFAIFKGVQLLLILFSALFLIRMLMRQYFPHVRESI